MNFSEKLPAFANPQGAAGKLLIASMNISILPCPSGGFPIWILPVMKNPRHRLRRRHQPVPLFKESSPRSRDRHRSFTGLRELFFYAQPQCHCGRTVFRL